MCGIYLTNLPFEKNTIEKKLSSIGFRGPDNLSVEKINDVSLGHLRLSILDLDNRSNQPMNKDNLHIVFNGEIYNYKEVRGELKNLGHVFKTESDTEVLLLGFKEWGSGILKKINGMFAFCIYDSINETIFGARDRIGVKPFFYYWNEGKFEIASQLRPLINSESEINKNAVSIYLDSGYVPSPYSIIDSIFKLQPGNFLEIDIKKKALEIKEYWNLVPVKIRNISYNSAKKELHKLLIDAVRIRLQSDVPLGSFLSGGIDSALVSSIAAKISNTPINTYTIGFQDPKYDESEIAAQYSKIIKSNHTETICTPDDALMMIPKFINVYDEPFSDSSALPSLLLSSITKKHVTVALAGDGGDESNFGYLYYDLIKKFNVVSIIPYRVRKILAKLPWHRIFGGRPLTIRAILSSKDSVDLYNKRISGFDSLQLKEDHNWQQNYNKYKLLSRNSFQRVSDLCIKLWLENDSCTKVDRSSMAFSLEIRSPFLDYRIIQFARTLPVKYRYKNGIKKRMLKDILKEYIPETIFNQPKKGFSIPLHKWIRNELKDEILSELNDDFLNKVPNLNIAKFKQILNDHMADKYNYHTEIWRLYVLAKWYKEFNFK